MLNINQIIFVGETRDGQAFVKVRPHKTDETKLALKSNLPECGAMLCKGLGIEAGNEWKGSNHFITEVDKTAFTAGLGNISDALQQPALPSPQPQQVEGGKCMECGNDDGTHWGFCPNHVENSPKLLN